MEIKTGNVYICNKELSIKAEGFKYTILTKGSFFIIDRKEDDYFIAKVLQGQQEISISEDWIQKNCRKAK